MQGELKGSVATETAATPRRLGEYLQCSPESVRKALAQQRQNGGAQQVRLGDILLRSGEIDARELRDALLRQRHDRLRTCALFSDLSDFEVNQVCEIVQEATVAAGSTFIQQGASGECLFVVASGRIHVFGHYVGHEGSAAESELTTLGPGETLGEMGYFSGGKRSASARAQEQSELLKIPYDAMSDLFDVIPSLGNGFLRIVTARLRNLNYQYYSSDHHRRAVEKSLRHLNEYLDAGDQAALRVDLEQGIEALIERLVCTASRIMRADRASLFLVDATTGDLWSKVAEGEHNREIRIRAGEGIAGWVAQRGHLLNIPDAYADERFNKAVDLRTGFHTRSILCGPVRNLQGQIIGVIQVINKHNSAGTAAQGVVFAHEDETMFKAFAHQAAIAVENFHLFQRLKANHEKMALMLDVATSVAQTLDLPQLIKEIVSKVKEILQCERASFFVYDRQTNELWSMEASGAEVKEIRFPASSGLAGHTARTGEVLNILDAYEDPRFNRDFDKKMNYRTRSVLCVPVQDRQERVTGVTQAINKIGGPFGSEDIAFLRAISSQISVAIDNAQLFARANAMKDYLENVQQSISNGILTLDETYRIVTANKAAGTLMGLTRQEDWLRQDLRQVLGAPNAALMELIERAYAVRHDAPEPTVAFDVDVELPRSKAKSSVVNVNILPLQVAEEESNAARRQGLVVLLEDVTREKRAVGTLSRYVAREVAEQILADPERLKLGGTRIKTTILFSDIRRFTAMSEGMEAEEVVELLNNYFTVMVEEVLTQRGMLDKFIGDELMALFGVPFTHPDDAVRAARTALCMASALNNFNDARSRLGLPPVLIGIGINTGEVICGNIGSNKHMNYTVIGDAVNIANRIESLTKYYGTQILLSESTREGIGGQFALRLVDRVIVMGKSTPTPVYQLLGEAGTSLTEGQKLFEEANHLYHRRQFAEALELFRRGAPHDPPCRVFVDRCEHFLIAPPPADWDGVWKATGK